MGRAAETGEQVCLDHGVVGGGLLELVNRSVLIMGVWGRAAGAGEQVCLDHGGVTEGCWSL